MPLDSARQPEPDISTLEKPDICIWGLQGCGVDRAFIRDRLAGQEESELGALGQR
jgi:hypothetical protein